MMHSIRLFLCLLMACLSISVLAIEPDETIQLWPGEPPGESRVAGPEKKLEDRPRPFYQLTDISEPQLKVLLPDPKLANGTAILVCPGGGLQRLAYEHEGLEVGQWLNSLGITAFVLKYRVPAPSQTGMKDAQRAMGLIRGQADRWNLDPQAIGILGFSAGGEIAVMLATHPEGRDYESIDPFDAVSCRPDFVGLVYPGGLVRFRSGLRESIAERIQPGLPPMFLTHAFNDGCQNSLLLAVALKQASVPTELHLYHDGGHGFGVRKSGLPVDDWTKRFEEWLQSMGYLDPKAVRSFVHEWTHAIENRQVPKSFTASLPNATLNEAYIAQQRIVRHDLASKQIGGYKGAGASAAAQTALGIDRPLTGVLFKEGRIEADEGLIFHLETTGNLAVETEIGYLMGVDFSYEVLTDEQAREVVAGIVPVIELPGSSPSSGAAPSARDMVASNVGSGRYIVGKTLTHDDVDPNQWPITIKRDGEVLHTTNGNTAKGGQWRNLRLILNQIASQGYTIPAGSVVICGALGGVHSGVPGRYEAQFGDQATIRFEIR